LKLNIYFQNKTVQQRIPNISRIFQGHHYSGRDRW